jgi:hypothetical protein
VFDGSAQLMLFLHVSIVTLVAKVPYRHCCQLVHLLVSLAVIHNYIKNQPIKNEEAEVKEASLFE